MQLKYAQELLMLLLSQFYVGIYLATNKYNNFISTVNQLIILS